MFYILRKCGLGYTTCREVQKHYPDDIKVIKSINEITNPNQEKDIVLRWGTTQSFPYQGKILNKTINISLVGNKKQFRKICIDNIPEITPKTWFDYNDPTIEYPVILREQHHAQGKHLYFCKNREDLELNSNSLTNPFNYYISTYIPKQKEYRVFFVQGRVVWVAEKIPKDEQAIAWNVAQGGKFINVPWKQWDISIIEDAYKAYKLSGLWLGGVDIMKDGHNNYIIEINSAPSQTSPYRQSCFAKTIKWSINNGYDFLEPNENYKKYSKWIHPGVKNNE